MMKKNGIYMASLLCIALLTACGQVKQKEQSAEEQPEVLCGSDKDEHGCIATAGYIWSEVQQNCIRLFESGIRLEAVDGKSSAFLVFSPDSVRVELFFSNEDPTEILNRRTLPSGVSVWNREDDDTKNVSLADQRWTISRRGSELYRQENED